MPRKNMRKRVFSGEITCVSYDDDFEKCVVVGGALVGDDLVAQVLDVSQVVGVALGVNWGHIHF